MQDRDCVAFLQWSLPKMGFRWPGFRKVRRQVCRRITKRLRELELEDLSAYREHLESHPAEWKTLDSFCRITISRFFRDREVFETLYWQILPGMIRNLENEPERVLRIWSVGCGAGEEPYSLNILKKNHHEPEIRLCPIEIIATDSLANQLERAVAGVYPRGCMVDMPKDLQVLTCEELGNDRLRLRDTYRQGVQFIQQDVRDQMPNGPFHLILCRNLVFTYFAKELQMKLLESFVARLRPGGYLVLGGHEELPAKHRFLTVDDQKPGFLQRLPGMLIETERQPATPSGKGSNLRSGVRIRIIRSPKAG